MTIFMLSFVLFLAIFAAMAMGYLLRKKRIQGSCGGIAALGLEKSCDCTHACEQPTTRQATKQ